MSPQLPSHPSHDATLLGGVIDRITTHLLDPPRGHDPVIAYASPDELAAAFAQTVGLAFDDEAGPHPDADLLAAVDQVIDRSMHTSHPRFVNQNFAGPDPISVVGDWLGAVLNTTAATYEVAPVFTLMESAVLDKLGRLAGYVDRLGGRPGGPAPGPATRPVLCRRIHGHPAVPAARSAPPPTRHGHGRLQR